MQVISYILIILKHNSVLFTISKVINAESPINCFFFFFFFWGGAMCMYGTPAELYEHEELTSNPPPPTPIESGGT